ncbi:hypothetical protein pipiens_000048, partial [Culex pipiens pipiens]
MNFVVVVVEPKPIG